MELVIGLGILALLWCLGIVLYRLLFPKSTREIATELLELLRQAYPVPDEKTARKILNLLPLKVKTLKLHDGSHPGSAPYISKAPKAVSRFFGTETWSIEDVKNYRNSL